MPPAVAPGPEMRRAAAPVRLERGRHLLDAQAGKSRVLDVPYNVQLLAHQCWNGLRERHPPALGPEDVATIHVSAARRLDPVYSEQWLGLSGAQRIVQSLGGGIHFTSEPGQGTTFTVELPKMEEAARGGEKKAA